MVRSTAALIVSFILSAHPFANSEDSRAPFFPLQEKWTVDLGYPPSAPPAFGEEYAYVPLENGTLVAIALTDGTVRWRMAGSTDFTPAVGNGTLVVAHGTILLGLNLIDGTHLWQIEMSARISGPPLLNGGWLIAVLDNGEIVALRASDGVELWRQQLYGELTVRPSIGGDELYVPVDDGRVISLELASGYVLWERRLSGSPEEVLALDDLFVGTTDNYFYRLSQIDGRTIWRWRTGGDIVGRAAVDEERVFFVSLDNILRALDRDSGVQQWRRPLLGRPTSGPQLTLELTLVSGIAPTVMAFNTRLGLPAGILTSPAEFAAPVHILRAPSPLAPGLVLATGDGQLFGYFTATGPIQFSLESPPPPLLLLPNLLKLEDFLYFPSRRYEGCDPL
mgnify:CR=1 FL=1